MYHSFVDAMPLGLCVNCEDQTSGHHMDPTDKEKTRMQSCSTPAPSLLLEKNPRRWRGSRGALGLASASGLALVDQRMGFAACTAEHAAPTVSMRAGTPTSLSCPKPCRSLEPLPETETLSLDIAPHSVCPVVYI